MGAYSDTAPWLGALAGGGLGLLVGSFLNVLIHRLPSMVEQRARAEAQALLDAGAAAPAAPYHLAWPPSHCPQCQRRLRPWENIPVLSYLLQGGRCRGCRRPIPARYPLIELASAAASAAVVAVAGPTPQALALLGLTWTLLAAAAIDYEHYLLPDALTLPLLWAGLLWSLLPASPLAPGDAVIGAAAGYTALWAVYHGHRLITGREGMGHGDFKLTGALGAWLGWQPLPALVLLAASGGLVAALALALRRRSLAQPLPFGPALAASGWALAVALQGGAAWPLIPAY